MLVKRRTLYIECRLHEKVPPDRAFVKSFTAAETRPTEFHFTAQNNFGLKLVFKMYEVNYSNAVD